ncbi:PaaI family thioesterase [Neobacillus dielmonensis]|uniref:PaaI family thioesterase n=1 Tax=Neobacillus dielmonensis TaxID=1347369 RepID=UPI0005A8C1C6|nr:PaaI family thioesterase [Neobacillus dielmonensis]
MAYLDTLQKMMDGEVPPPPISQFLGLNLVEAGEGLVIFEMEATDEMDNPMGTLHGGILCDLSDAAMGCAFATTLPDNVSYTTVELKLNFLKPAWNSKLRAVGRVIKTGNTTGLVECQVFDSKDSLVAHATSTCMILTGENRIER